MKVSLSQIKSWFKKGMYPTESQFANTFDSFWHKDDTLPLSAIQNLMQILNDKASVQLVSGKQDKTDTTLQTADKTVVGAINEVNTKTSNIEREIGNEDLLSDHAQSIKGAIAEINTWRGNASQDIEHLVGDMPFKQDKTDTTLQTADKTVVGAINEVNTKTSNIEREVGDMPFKQDKTDTTLQTADKTVVGAINEVNTKTSNIEREIGNEDLLSDHAQSIKGAIAEINTWRGNASQDIEHLVGDMPFKQDKTDNSLKTICKTIVGAINELWEKVEDLWEKYIRGIDKVTHAELVAMRDAGELIAGRRYRIIDFVTTTSQPDTRSAGHRFDIIVMADSSSTLNENATAIKHKFTEEELVVPTYFLWRSDNDADYGIITKVRVPQSLDDIVGRYTNDGEEYISNKMLGNYTELSSANEDEMLLKWLYTNEDDPNDTESGTDTYSFVSEITFDETDDPNYFADSKLNAWQLKYCLDNDITRYLYTDPEKGKGVIYYLEDEFGNKGDFDFKNIQHKRYKVTDDSADGILSLLDGQYVGFNADMQDLIIEDDSDYIWAFSASMPSYSLDEDTEELNLDMTNQLDATLNRLPEGTGIDADGGGYAHPVIFCKNNRFVTHQISMSLDDGTWVYPYRVSNIVLFCYPKYFSGDDVIPARVEFENCSDNVLASDSDFITANSMFSRNTFLTANSNLIFGRSVGRTIFKGDCYRCTFGGNIVDTTFGGYIYGSTFGGYIYGSTFGGYIVETTFGGYIDYVTFGGYIVETTFGGYIVETTFGGYIENTTFGGEIWETTFGGYIYGSTFGGGLSSCTFGGEIWETTFGGDIWRTTFGGYIENTTFGGYIGYTTFGGYIYGSTFGGNLSNGHIHGYLYHFTIGKEGETWTNLVINPGVEYLTVTCSDTSEGEIKNVYIYGGVCGTESETLTVIIPIRNNSLVEIKPTSKEEILV